jgi:hypothetical protein
VGKLRIPLALLAAALIGSIALAVRAQSPHCDPYLRISQEHPLGYRLRGDRCEGAYVQQVTNTPLLVASFGRLNLPPIAGQDKSVVVEWVPVAEELRLRTYSLKPRTYYRMDSRRPRGEGSYRWSGELFTALELTPADIGIVAWTDRNVAGTQREIYVPVRIGMPLSTWDGTYDLLVVPGHELKEMFVGLKAVSGDGVTSTVVMKPAPLKHGYYPPGRAIRVPLRPASPGMYVVEISATLRAGGAISHELWFVHDAGSRR